MYRADEPTSQFRADIAHHHNLPNGDIPVREVIIHLSQLIKRRGNPADQTTINSMVLALQHAGAPSSDLDQRVRALWNALPYIEASDQLRRSVTTKVVWELLVQHAVEQELINQAEAEQYRSFDN